MEGETKTERGREKVDGQRALFINFPCLGIESKQSYYSLCEHEQRTWVEFKYQVNYILYLWTHLLSLDDQEVENIR